MEPRVTHWIDVTAVVLLSAGTLAASWCTYQAELWSGIQAQKYTAAGAVNVQAALASTRAARQEGIDIGLFVAWLRATAEGRVDLATFHERRFRPEFTPAFRKWVAAEPIRNPAAPVSPFALEEYRIAERERASALAEDAYRKFDEGRVANERSDVYVRNTVVLGGVVFLAGIAQVLKLPRHRLVLTVVAALLFLVGLYRIATSPLA